MGGKLLTRRGLLLAGAASAGVVAADTWRLDVSHTVVPIAKPGGLRVRVAHLSDFHASWCVPRPLIETAVSQAVAARPDIICVTGDFITHDLGSMGAWYLGVLRWLSQAAPTFAVVGNHDGGAWASEHYGNDNHRAVDRLLEESQIELLHNRSTVLDLKDGGRLQLAGVADLWSTELNVPKAFANVRRHADLPAVLLAHNPDTKDAAGMFAWDLMLSGHTHGGQVLIPFDGPRFAPVADRRFVAGLGQWEDRKIYVTRGVGNIGGVRLRCRPEVSLLEIQCG